MTASISWFGEDVAATYDEEFSAEFSQGAIEQTVDAPVTLAGGASFTDQRVHVSVSQKEVNGVDS